MAERGEKDWLQPSLLDRLTDDDPTNSKEGPDTRFLTVDRLRYAVRRDLSWLLNTSDLECVVDLSDYPLVAKSVLNYGIRELAGSSTSGTNARQLEQTVRETILNFEPRLIPETLHVTVVLDAEAMSHNALAFEVRADLWALPAPVDVVWQTQVDLETGMVTVE